jgi:hypothetical protein
MQRTLRFAEQVTCMGEVKVLHFCRTFEAGTRISAIS